MTDIAEIFRRPEFPKSSSYDPEWMMDNQMGPNAVWLAEWLTEGMDLREGSRVLDLGCGKALTSIFLAREFGVQVWAADLWIGPDHNWRRAVEAGVGSRVFPLRAEAHSLPFAEGFFDAVVSVDAYQYFGTDELYLGYLARFLRPGAAIGVVVPALMREIVDVPAHLLAPQANGKVFWEDECWSFKTSAWWERLWKRSGKVQGVRTDTLPDGWRHWRDFERALEAAGKGIFPSDAEALDRDAGATIGFARMLAERGDGEVMNLYDPALGTQVGLDH
ncbi:MAG: methyltransferase domain-containing protein [Bacteroidetes bacterium]|nr:methyltransferase domain-containing protein [Bacteroidota bacterium]